MLSDHISVIPRLDQRLKDKMADVHAQRIRGQVESLGERLLRHATWFTRMFNNLCLRWGHLDAPPKPQFIVCVFGGPPRKPQAEAVRAAIRRYERGRTVGKANVSSLRK